MTRSAKSGGGNHPGREGGGEKASQYGGTLHNFLTVLIYRLADLAPSQYGITFVIFELEPRRRERERKRGEGR